MLLNVLMKNSFKALCFYTNCISDFELPFAQMPAGANQSLEPQVRRGGCPKTAASMLELHQRLLEESLNCSDHVLDRRKAAAADSMSRNSASRTSLVFSRGTQHNNQDNLSLPRRHHRTNKGRSSIKYKKHAPAAVGSNSQNQAVTAAKANQSFHSQVVNKSSDQFFA